MTTPKQDIHYEIRFGCLIYTDHAEHTPVVQKFSNVSKAIRYALRIKKMADIHFQNGIKGKPTKISKWLENNFGLYGHVNKFIGLFQINSTEISLEIKEK